MKIHNIGIVSPGDMGQGVALTLKNSGFAVHTALDGRSARTKALARDAGLNDCGSMQNLIASCDVVLSILNPAAAVDNARAAAAAMQATGRRCVFVDCNAIAPQTAREIDAIIRAAGGDCIDAGIIGPPPRGKAKTNLYVSGPGAADLVQLAGPQLLVHVVSDRIGDASALKMCYGAINKGTQALWLEVLIAAQRLGVDGMLETQLQQSRADFYESMIGQFPLMPSKAYRWVPEMIEISKTLGAAGITPKVFQGAADIFEFVAGTALGKETPENRDKARGGKDVVRLLAQARGLS